MWFSLESTSERGNSNSESAKYELQSQSRFVEHQSSSLFSLEGDFSNSCESNSSCWAGQRQTKIDPELCQPD